MKEMLRRLEEFDKAHGWDRYNKITNDKKRIEATQLEIINLLGELGELANEVKKCRRKGVFNEDKIKEETTDMFIFFLKLSKVINLDIEKEFNKKMDLNDERFKKYKK